MDHVWIILTPMYGSCIDHFGVGYSSCIDHCIDHSLKMSDQYKYFLKNRSLSSRGYKKFHIFFEAYCMYFCMGYDNSVTAAGQGVINGHEYVLISESVHFSVISFYKWMFF